MIHLQGSGDYLVQTTISSGQMATPTCCYTLCPEVSFTEMRNYPQKGWMRQICNHSAELPTQKQKCTGRFEEITKTKYFKECELPGRK